MKVKFKKISIDVYHRLLVFFTQNLGQIRVLWTIELLMNAHYESEMSKS